MIERIHRLKTLEVEINCGGQGSKKRFKVVRSANPGDLVFQSLRRGEPMNDQNILKRHLRPAAKKLGLEEKKATGAGDLDKAMEHAREAFEIHDPFLIVGKCIPFAGLREDPRFHEILVRMGLN